MQDYHQYIYLRCKKQSAFVIINSKEFFINFNSLRLNEKMVTLKQGSTGKVRTKNKKI